MCWFLAECKNTTFFWNSLFYTKKFNFRKFFLSPQITQILQIILMKHRTVVLD